MKVQGVIDSMNFSSSCLKNFYCSEDYTIRVVKGIGVFEPEIWNEEFRTELASKKMQSFIEIKLLYTSKGLVLPIKRHSRSKDREIIEFAGLHGFNDRAKLLSELLEELWIQIQDEYVVRLDIAIDFKGKMPQKVIKQLCKGREPFRYWNTTYYKSKSEKKSNNRLNIKSYRKDKRNNNLDEETTRLEFSFLSSYFGKLQVKDLNQSFKKMTKTIKRLSGLEVRIQSL